jgi:hypothetical protein
LKNNFESSFKLATIDLSSFEKDNQRNEERHKTHMYYLK